MATQLKPIDEIDGPTLRVRLVANEIKNARSRGRSTLSESAGKFILSEYGVQVPKGYVITDEAQVAAALTRLAAPYALKLMSPAVVHKTDFGAVQLGLLDELSIKSGMQKMRALAAAAGITVEGYLLEEMAPQGHELVVGGFRDAQFGPVLMLGLGGVFVEVLEDVSFRICPIDENDAQEMIDELHGVAILDGARGKPPASRRAIVDVLLRLGGKAGLLVEHLAEFSECDVNPVIVNASSAIAVDARFVLSAEEPASSTIAEMPLEKPDFSPLFAPQSIAVIGASQSGSSVGNFFLRHLREFGYEGSIYAIHPSARSIDGVPAYPSLAATPTPIDYAYVALPAEHLSSALSAGSGRVRFAQVLAGGFGEVRGGDDTEARLVETARDAGIRLLGPNSLGTYSPYGKLTFTDRTISDAGHVGVISQSGGLGVDILRLGGQRGLRFSGLVSVGNCADIGIVDLLAYYLEDPRTDVIGIYLESIKHGDSFLRILRAARGIKPVVLLKGGGTEQGQSAATSHTGALAGDHRIWSALARQTGCTLVETLDDFLNIILGFQCLRPRSRESSKDVVLFGNGGGASVLAADAFARAGLEVTALPARTIEALKLLDLPPGTSVVNPIDAPVWTLAQHGGKVARSIMEAVLETADPGAIVTHLNVGVILGNTDPSMNVLSNLVDAVIEGHMRSVGRCHHMLVLRSDEDQRTEALKRVCRERALKGGLPVYDELTDAATALAAIIRHEQFRTRRLGIRVEAG